MKIEEVNVDDKYFLCIGYFVQFNFFKDLLPNFNHRHFSVLSSLAGLFVHQMPLGDSTKTEHRLDRLGV